MSQLESGKANTVHTCISLKGRVAFVVRSKSLCIRLLKPGHHHHLNKVNDCTKPIVLLGLEEDDDSAAVHLHARIPGNMWIHNG